LKFYPY